jgi:hypothetical protein
MDDEMLRLNPEQRIYAPKLIRRLLLDLNQPEERPMISMGDKTIDPLTEEIIDIDS